MLGELLLPGRPIDSPPRLIRKNSNDDDGGGGCRLQDCPLINRVAFKLSYTRESTLPTYIYRCAIFRSALYSSIQSSNIFKPIVVILIMYIYTLFELLGSERESSLLLARARPYWPDAAGPGYHKQHTDTQSPSGFRSHRREIEERERRERSSI